jgi:hypothetical protein
VAPLVFGLIVDLFETKIQAKNTKGWTPTIFNYPLCTNEKLKTFNITTYMQTTRNKEIANKRLTILAPMLWLF